MKKWLKKFEDAMAATAFAEAGEFETARETLREQRKILLALIGEQSDINAFKYALNMCKRIDAELEILYVSEPSNDLLNQFRSELEKEGIKYYLIQKSGCLKEEILNYTNEKRGILFVVVESSEGLDINCKKADKILKESWKNLKCPLVVVSDLVMA
jgi:hypothetical protein